MPKPRNLNQGEYPYGHFNYLLEIEGVTQAGFSEVSGIVSETQIIEYREGSDRTGSVRKIPGLHKFGNLTLKRGITTDLSLWQWRQLVVNGSVDRRAGSIILLNAAREEVLRWNFFNAWPCKWVGPVLCGKSGEVAIETLEIAVEKIELA